MSSEDAIIRPPWMGSDNRMNRMDELPTTLMTLALLLMLWVGLAQAGTTPLGAPEIQAIKDRGVLRVAMPSEDLPYYYCRGPDGEMEGHEVDLARSLAQDLGVRLELDRVAKNYEQVLTRVRERQADLGICVLSKTTSRAQEVLMSRPYLLVHPTVVVNRLRLAQLGDGITGRQGLRRPGVEIVVPEGTSYVGYAQADFPEARIVTRASADRCWEEVLNGKVFAFYYDEIEIKSRLKRDPYLKIPLEVVALEEVNDYIAVAVPPNHWSLLYYVNTYLDLNRPEIMTPDEIMRRYRDPTQSVTETVGKSVHKNPGEGTEKWWVVAAAAGGVGLMLALRRRSPVKAASPPLSLTAALGSGLLSPRAVIVAIVAGAIIGIYFRPLARVMQPLGALYMALLQMCVLPVIMVTVVNSLGLFLREGGIRQVLTRLAAVTVLATLLVSAFGTLGTSVAGIGSHLDLDSKNILGDFLSRHEEEFKEPASEGGDAQNVWAFVKKLVPENIFADLVAGNTLSVLFFSALLGVALGLSGRGGKGEIFAVLESLYAALSRIVQWLMYGLPLGMCCLIASMFAAAGLEILLSATWFIVFLYSGILVVMAAGSLVVWRRSGHSYLASLSALRRPLLVGLGNGRPMAAIPQAIDSLSADLGFHACTTRLIVPLTFSAISFGNILHFSASAIFLSHLYGAPVGLQEYAIIIFASVVAGMAASNAPGLIALSMMGIVLAPLKLPLAPSIALLFALDPLLDQPLALASVYGNCACTALVAQPSIQRSLVTAHR